MKQNTAEMIDLGAYEAKARITSSPLDKFIIEGGHALEGNLKISGAKNAALKLMCAAILTDEPLTLSNMPVTLRDMTTLGVLLKHIGVSTMFRRDGVVMLHARDIPNPFAPYDLVRKMRASVQVLGPLLARCGHAEVSLPGGCSIGARPVDQHIKGLEALGVEINIEDGYIKAKAPRGLIGADFTFEKITHGGTENVMCAATLAKGTTILRNCAEEPEIIDLANCLNAMGAKISGAGTDTITIEGVARLNGISYAVMPDRLEAGTWMIAGALTGGKLMLQNADTGYMGSFIEALKQTGITIEKNEDGIRAYQSGDLTACDITTEPYPGFPTDLQAQFMTLLTQCAGTSHVRETVFENRFMHVPELSRMGVDIQINGNEAIVKGKTKLKGAEVMATDIRASVALVIAGLIAEGQTTVNRIYHLERGYEDIVGKLSACGAQIRKAKD